MQTALSAINKSAVDGDYPVGLTELFKIGVGPSSSHTMGPMTAAALFVASLGDRTASTSRLQVTVYGPLAWTGKGHATDTALVLGLAGERPHTVEPDRMQISVRRVHTTNRLQLPGGHSIAFNPRRDIIFDREHMFAHHPNAMLFEAFDDRGSVLTREVWYSTGGGFVERAGEGSRANAVAGRIPVYPYTNGEALVAMCRESGLSIEGVVMANEVVRRPENEVRAEIDLIIDTMFDSIERGLNASGTLPGGLGVNRRAGKLVTQLREKGQPGDSPHSFINHVAAFAIAVSEENAAGSRIVTAPTNGAAGVVPAVLRYYRDFCGSADRKGMHTFILTATAIGGIARRNASICGAEVGCQGEVGVASSMAAAGLAAALGASSAQIENAAEIAIEHHLGMTCDPVRGLVQIPCIERNAVGAVKAIAAASIAQCGDGIHKVSFDQVVETMRQTGLDMASEYRETARGGLAVNVPAC